MKQRNVKTKKNDLKKKKAKSMARENSMQW